LRVALSKEGKPERLGDLAQVLPKGGRSVGILVGEKDVSLPILLFNFMVSVLKVLVGCSGMRTNTAWLAHQSDYFGNSEFERSEFTTTTGCSQSVATQCPYPTTDEGK